VEKHEYSAAADTAVKGLNTLQSFNDMVVADKKVIQEHKKKMKGVAKGDQLPPPRVFTKRMVPDVSLDPSVPFIRGGGIVQAMAIFEPGKIRMITKSDGYSGLSLLPIQGLMRSCWKANKCSTMLMSDSDLLNRFNDLWFGSVGSFFRRYASSRRGAFMVSGDFKSATDLVRTPASTASFDCLVEARVPGSGFLRTTQLRPSAVVYPHPDWLSVLAAHAIKYEEAGNDLVKRQAANDFKDAYSGPKQLIARCLNMQYMGHHTSFPQLCVLNLAAYRWAVKEYRKELLEAWTDACQLHRRRRERLLGVLSSGTHAASDVLTAMLEVSNAEDGEYECRKVLDAFDSLDMDNSVLINGDDIAYVGDERFRDLYDYAASQMGFVKSPGKNFESTTSVQINSRIFTVQGGSFAQVGYLNMRLLTGLSQKTGESLSTPIGLATSLNKMCQLEPWTKWAVPVAMKRFQKDWLNGKGLGVPGLVPNWYLPTHMGGYGLHTDLLPTAGDLRVTPLQRRLATYFLSDPELSLYEPMIATPTIKDVILRAAMTQKHLQPGSWVPPAHLVRRSDGLDPWQERLEYMARALHAGPLDTIQGGKRVTRDMLELQRPNVRMIRKFVKGIRCTHMLSQKRMVQLWDAVWYVTQPPACPPLHPLSYPDADLLCLEE